MRAVAVPLKFGMHCIDEDKDFPKANTPAYGLPFVQSTARGANNDITKVNHNGVMRNTVVRPAMSRESRSLHYGGEEQRLRTCGHTRSTIAAGQCTLQAPRVEFGTNEEQIAKVPGRQMITGQPFSFGRIPMHTTLRGSS
jgi:hypothetical protein